MKASRILAGLSAVSLAASMLSMVAASADNPFTVDEGEATGFTGFVNDPEPEEDGVEVVSDTTGTTTETATASDYDFAAMWNKRPWYNAIGPVSTFAGWPGWGVKAFPAGWEWIEFYKALQNNVWEEFAKKDQDTAAAGYLVFEFDGGKKQVVPVDVDANGQYVTDEFLIPFMNVQKVYFLYEVSEAPYLDISLDAFNVNGKDVELFDKRNEWDNKKLFVDRDWVNQGTSTVTAVSTDENGNPIDAAEEDLPMFYSYTIFDKTAENTNKDKTPINHGLILWGTKAKVTFTVNGIGKYPVHPETKAPGQLNDGLGDDDGDIHTHVQPEEADGPFGSGQRRNLDVKPINPMFGPSADGTCSQDLYDALVEVYNSKDDHSADAEISFKTVADNNGVLVANFINVWEVDEDKDGKAATWLKDFERGFAVYVDEADVLVGYQTQTVKCYKLRDGQPFKSETKNADGTISYGDYVTEDQEIVFDGKTEYWPVNKEGIPEKKIAEKKELKEKHWVFSTDDDRNGKPVHKDKVADPRDPYGSDTMYQAIEPDADGTYKSAKDNGLFATTEGHTETAYCWHPYFITENGLVDVVTKNDLGQNKTNYASYKALTDAEIKYMKNNNGMYFNDDIHSAAYGHFVVFGDNTLREYKYRIKSDAVKAMLEAVQRSVALRDEFIWRHGALDIWQWNAGSDSLKFGPNNKLIIEGDHAFGFTKDYESKYWLDDQVKYDGYEKVTVLDKQTEEVGYEHHRAVHGAIWLQCCEGTVLRDVRVHAHTDIITQDTIPTLYGKENYDALFPKKPAESKAEAANGGAAQPTADAGAADNNTESGAAAGFGIAGLLLAGAAMVCVKKKN